VYLLPLPYGELNVTVEDDVHKMSGPLLLLAGPGTGKTHSLARRMKYLVEDECVNPENITVITFTAPAARNMHERISDSSNQELYVPPESQPNLICTMHSLGYRILREKASALGLKDDIRVVYSDSLRNILVGDAAQLAGFQREDADETSKCRQYGKCSRSDEKKKCKICDEYRKVLNCCSAIDYDDQIMLACEVLREDSELLKKYRLRCQHLLVDEYQDINAGQFELIQILSEDQPEGLFVVGDDDQSIYSWRGGSPEFIRNFGIHFGSEAKIIPLEKSFRCHPHILDGALSVVAEYDKNRLSKHKLEYKTEEGAKIKIHNVPSDKKEASVVRRIAEKAIPSRSVLILLPHRGFSKAIIEELRRAGIRFTAPMPLPGDGVPLISTLSRWLMNNADSLSFRECLEACINNPNFGIPSKDSRKKEKLEDREKNLHKISTLWKHVIEGDANSFWHSLEHRKNDGDLYSKTFSAFDKVRSLNDSQDDPASFLCEVVKVLHPWRKTKQLLEELESWVESSGQVFYIGQRTSVQLMTLQGAKGLEADIVCVVGLEEGILPRSGSSEEEIAEQSRLMFVSMTRAIEELHIFHARKRSGALMFRPIYRKGKPPDLQRSRFIDSIPNEHKEVQYHKFG
jgi:DNA helicase-2/ATP-dependent DNA helicase PcrA